MGIAGRWLAGHRFPIARLILGLIALGPATVQARTLLVGPGQDYALPSDAAHAVAAGDQVRILDGTYYDCAVWAADDLVIEGSGPGTVLTDTACEGKASFVIISRGVTVRDITFARIRVADGNGAGIRAEGPDLLVERVRFENNQEGLLAAAAPGGTLQVIDSTFSGNGASAASASLVVGSMARLLVRNTTFEEGRAGAAIVSYADMTEIDGSRVAVAKAAAASTVEVSGGLRIENTVLQAGRQAVLAMPAPGAPLILRRDTLTGGGVLLVNWSGHAATLADNNLAGGLEQSTAGAWSYQARAALRDAYAKLRGAAHHVVGLFR